MIGTARTSVLVLLFVVLLAYLYKENAKVVDTVRTLTLKLFKNFVEEEEEEEFSADQDDIMQKFLTVRQSIDKYSKVTEEYGIAMEKDLALDVVKA